MKSLVAAAALALLAAPAVSVALVERASGPSWFLGERGGAFAGAIQLIEAAPFCSAGLL